MLRLLVGNKIDGVLTTIAHHLHQKKITPNHLTFTGLAINTIGALCYYNGWMFMGGMVILFAGLFDMLDGAVARVSNTVSKIGAFTDSVVDRYSDFIIFGGILAFFAKEGNLGGTLLVLLIVCGSFLTSYIRARAELVIPSCDVGLMERPERIIILAVGSMINFFSLALWILAVGTHLTAVHRIWYTYKNNKDKG